MIRVGRCLADPDAMSPDRNTVVAACRASSRCTGCSMEGRVDEGTVGEPGSRKPRARRGQARETGRAMVQPDIEQAGQRVAGGPAMAAADWNWSGPEGDRDRGHWWSRIGRCCSSAWDSVPSSCPRAPAFMPFHRCAHCGGLARSSGRVKRSLSGVQTIGAIPGLNRGVHGCAESLGCREQSVNHARSMRGGVEPLPLRKIQRFGTITRNVRQA